MSPSDIFIKYSNKTEEKPTAGQLEDVLSDIGFFHEMADGALEGTMLHRSHIPIYVNRAWAELHGMTVDQVMAMPSLLDLIHRSDRERLCGYAELLMAGGTPPVRYRYRAMHKDGHSIWLEHLVQAINWRGSRILKSTIIEVDDNVRQRFHSNQELHVHQWILDQLSERIVVIDRNYRYLIANQAYLEFRQVNREDIIGRDIQSVVGSVFFQDNIKYRLDRAINGFTSLTERQETLPDGTKRHYQVSAEPFRDPEGPIKGAIVSIRDITAARESQRQRHLFASVIEQSSDRIAVIGLDYCFRLANRAEADFHCCLQEDMIGCHIAGFVGQSYFDTFSKPAFDHCFKGEKVRFRRPKVGEDSERGMLDVRFEPYREADGTITGAIATLRDVTEAQEMAEKLAYQARFDQLTGLLNRRSFEQLLEKSITDARSGGRTHALCFIDLDQFKIINDTVGHLAGDRLLQQVAGLLTSKLHEDDILARFGGDEFVLLLRRCSLRRAERAAGQLMTELAEFRFFHEGLMFRIGASIGITAINRHVASVGDVLTQADLACYAAKDNGRSQVQVYRKCDVSIRRRQREMYRAGSIRAALDEGRFVLFGQLIAPMHQDSAEPERIEILLRMMGERKEIIKPPAFIPAAERYGFMAELDRWVIREAVQELTTPDASLDSANVSINLSGVTLNEETSLDFIHQTLTESCLCPKRIVFEITETAAIRNIATTQAFMHKLREWGCSFALDDFGSGLSSLKYLKSLPVDFLKIDGAFIRDVSKDAGSHAMVKAINQMAEDLGIKTVAEGVENLAILDTLKDLGIDYVQGYAIGMPMLLSPGTRASRTANAPTLQ